MMAAIKTWVRVDGLKELDAALAELPKATGKNVLKRTLTKAGKPIADRATSLAPRGATGYLEHHIVVSARIKNTVGNAEYAAAMKAGLGAEAAASALRAARKASAGTGSTAEVYVGPTVRGYYGMFQEFGTVHHKPQPFLRPAFDAGWTEALNLVRDTLAQEIERARARLARKAEREAAKLKAGR